MSKYYVYAHSAPGYGVFYIGKGSNERLFKTGNRSAFWKRIVGKHGFTASILETFDSEESAYEAEIGWIAYYKGLGQCAANFTLGGDGVRVVNRWWYDKVSKALTGIKRARGRDSKAYKQHISREVLHDLYVVQRLPIKEITKKLEVAIPTVYARLEEYGIPLQPSTKKQIVCISDGRIFDSITEASRQTGLFRENIRKVLAGKYKSTGGLTFKYREEI